MTSQPTHETKEQGADRTVTIFVNTDPHKVPLVQLPFGRLVALAYPGLVGNADYLFKISYRLGKGHSELKTLAEGQSVQAQEGMIFNVTYENRS